ncbi:hemolysin activation/secretion protein [Roseateles terrae]|uniref:Hemolysin activation/secretion protein n=1 Tax=Roseateles terrae TaxID=431060 RepID=A0ABR6GPF6_9BURK|nr:hemolysin activation/secretion protein [Roseateles terrae]
MALAVALLVGGLSAVPAPVLAQAGLPDAGLLRQDPAPPPTPKRPQDLSRPEDPRLAQEAKGVEGRRVVLTQVVVEGSTVIPDEAWEQRLSPLPEEGLTLRQMRALAEQVQGAVQEAGRPLAVAFLPPQDLSEGILRIQVVEGRYGQVASQGPLASEAAGWMAPLKPGLPIGPELERQMLLLSELPGVRAQATLSPGAAVGDADVSVDIHPGPTWGGELRVDNHGNRYAGRNRVVGNVYVNRLLVLGDQLTVAAGTGDEGGGQAQLGYGLPLGAQGMRLDLTTGFSRYELGREFDILGASGKVSTVSGTLTVPLQVTQRRRVSWSSGLQAQQISNRQALFEIEDRRSALAWVNTLQGAQWLSGGGAMWGRVSAETGRVRIKDHLSQEIDALTAQTAGGYLLLGMDVAMLKPIGDWQIFGRVAGQVGNRNLDPSRKWVLGGPNGVRAWPTSEGSGDDGALAQMEVRRQWGVFQPFLFVDAGRVQINHQPWVEGRNSRTLSGAGLGLRVNKGAWAVQSTAGWRLGPDRNAPQSDPGANAVQFWLTVGYQL